MEKVLKFFSYSMILVITMNMMSPLMIYAAVTPLPVNDYLGNRDYYQSPSNSLTKENYQQNVTYQKDLAEVQKKYEADTKKLNDLYRQYGKSRAKPTSEEDNVMLNKAIRMQSEKQSRASVYSGSYGYMDPGDMFIQYDWSLGNWAGGIGHAAIALGDDKKTTIESWPNGGVQLRKGSWDPGNGAKKFWKVAVKNYTLTKGYVAYRYASDQLNKPYNSWGVWNWSKWETNEFYCSQLVWRAWYERGIDIDSFPWDNIVSPMEIAKSGNVYIFGNVVLNK